MLMMLTFIGVMFIKDMFALTTAINFLLAPYFDACHAVKIITDKHIHVKLKAIVRHLGKYAYLLSC